VKYRMSLTKKERKELAGTIEVFLFQYIREDPSIDAFPWLKNMCKWQAHLKNFDEPLEMTVDGCEKEDLEAMLRMNIVSECESIENNDKDLDTLEHIFNLRRKIKDIRGWE